MNALQSYLSDLYEIRSSGGAVKETSGYSALSQLLNEIGKTLKPRVRCIINLQNQGTGLPDGGLYTADQFQKRTKVDPLEGQLPARGCFEVKSPGEDVSVVAKGEQVLRYLNKYRQVLVTNYRDFILVGLDRDHNLEIRERFTLAENEGDFWKLAAHPQAAANELGERFVEYLKRVMLHAAPLALPKDVAWFLASYARDAKARIESSNLPALLGERTCDVYLNDVAYWKNIPARVWDYTIGGYQVIKKWLSYRELELLGRPLTPDEAREVMNMARRIAAIVLLEPALDTNYQAVKNATYSWPG